MSAKNVQFIHHDFAVILPVNLLIHIYLFTTRLLKKTPHAITAQLLLTGPIFKPKSKVIDERVLKTKHVKIFSRLHRLFTGLSVLFSVTHMLQGKKMVLNYNKIIK